MWWSLKVNSALAALGVKPTLVNGEFRREMQQLGKLGHYTAEETALWIVSQMPLANKLETDNAVGVWIREGKLDLTKPDVRKAMYDLGYSGFLD